MSDERAKKRWRVPTANPGQLKAQYGRVDGGLDLAYAWGGKGADKCDVRVLMRALEDVPVFDGKPLRQVLTERGYDITTLRFSIDKEAAATAAIAALCGGRVDG